MTDKQLVVIGYSGNDESIMSFLENCMDDPSRLTKGLLWAIRKGSHVNPRVDGLIERAQKNGKYADIIEIDGFDQLLFSIYQIQNYHNNVIDGEGRIFREKSEIRLSGQPVDSFVKLNAYKAECRPLCNVFETDIASWSELRSIIIGTDTIAGLYSKHIYSFTADEKLKTVFNEHMLSSIRRGEAPENDVHRDDSVYVGLVYQLIKRSLLLKGMKSCGKYKVYNPSSLKNDQGFQVFDAVEFAVSLVAGSLYLNLLPTVYSQLPRIPLPMMPPWRMHFLRDRGIELKLV